MHKSLTFSTLDLLDARLDVLVTTCKPYSSLVLLESAPLSNHVISHYSHRLVISETTRGEVILACSTKLYRPILVSAYINNGFGAVCFNCSNTVVYRVIKRVIKSVLYSLLCEFVRQRVAYRILQVYNISTIMLSVFLSTLLHLMGLKVEVTIVVQTENIYQPCINDLTSEHS